MNLFFSCKSEKHCCLLFSQRQAFAQLAPWQHSQIIHSLMAETLGACLTVVAWHSVKSLVCHRHSWFHGNLNEGMTGNITVLRVLGLSVLLSQGPGLLLGIYKETEAQRLRWTKGGGAELTSAIQGLITVGIL